MSLIGRLSEKSWQTPGAGDVPQGEGRPPAGKIGLFVYFAVAASLFSLFGAAYLMRMGMGHAMEGMGDWRPMPELPLMWINSAILVLDSVAWEIARRGARDGNRSVMRAGMIAGGSLAILFVAGQLLLWRQFANLGYFAGANPANAFFYLLTALHALHIIGGLYFWARTLFRIRRGASDAEVRLPVELCAIYWHFLLLVWAVMLGLFIAT